jgi:protein CMS1
MALKVWRMTCSHSDHLRKFGSWPLDICPFGPCSLMHMAGQGGDDLEDDYVLDGPTATSGDEEEYSHHGSSHGDLSLDDDASRPSGSATHTEGETGNKRKRSGKDKQRKLKVSCLDFRPFDHPKLDTRKQKSKLKETQDEKSRLTTQQTPLELAEYLTGFQAKSFSRLSRIELEDIQIPGGCGLEESSRNDHRLTSSQRVRLLIHPHGLLKGLSTRCPISSLKVAPSHICRCGGIESFSLSVTPSLRLRLSQKPKANGAPTLIFVAGSALRVADVVTLLPVYPPEWLLTLRLDKSP